MGLILIEGYDDFTGPVSIGHKLAAETKRYTRAAVARHRGLSLAPDPERAGNALTASGRPILTDTSGNPSGQVHWRHLSAVRRELIEQNMTGREAELVTYPEIVAVERRVAASLYPKETA